MKGSKFFLLAAVFSLAAIPHSVFADSVKFSASTEIKLEIDSAPVQKTAEYTGVVIDCRGLGLQSSASPVIKSESGKIIYGDKDLNFDLINEIGMAEYATSIQQSAARAGEHPLIVQAVQLDKFRRSPILSNFDAERVLIADETSEFFKDLKVVFLTD